MTIYSSNKAVPYVYICTHKESGKFYIGYRMANVKLNLPSHLDLPEYKTSSTTVRPDWENYTWTIIAEFFDSGHAYTFEQQLICDNWKNPLLLNGMYRLGEHKQFRKSGPCSVEHRQKISDALKGRPSGQIPWNKGKTASAETKQKQSDAHKGKTASAETKQKMSDAGKGKTRSAEHRQKLSESGKNRPPISVETRQKLSDAKKGKPGPKKGIPRSVETKRKISDAKKGKPGKPLSAEHKQKISDSSKGRIYRKVECPHCGLVGKGSNMTRYHFDNCKMKPA